MIPCQIGSRSDDPCPKPAQWYLEGEIDRGTRQVIVWACDEHCKVALMHIDEGTARVWPAVGVAR